jgi:hypothetical protein
MRSAVLEDQPGPHIEDFLFSGCLLSFLLGIALFIWLCKGQQATDNTLRADERERDGSPFPFDETAVLPPVRAALTPDEVASLKEQYRTTSLYVRPKPEEGQ